MKKLTLLFLLVFGIQYTYSQVSTLPVDVEEELKRQISGPTDNFTPFDTVFKYNLPDTLVLTGVETDGNYYYLSSWWEKSFAKYDMDGNFIETFIINGGSGFSDMAYDGQFFYGGRPMGTTFFTLDLENKTIVDSISLPFKVKAIAYNHDLDVFYGNYWDDEIKIFKADGTILDTIPLSGTYASYIGFAYDGWTEGGPFLWGFSQDGNYHKTLVQMELPSGNETGLYIDMNDYWQGGPSAGGLFSYQDLANSKNILGGAIQNTYFFGLELIDISPPPISGYAVSYLHGNLSDSTDVLLSWAPARYYLFNEYFDHALFPPMGWEKTNYSNNGAGWNNMIPNYVFWPVPEIDSRFAVAYEDLWSEIGCCDYLISPEINLENQYDYYLSFESYYDGSNNHSAYVEYTLDDGQTWEVLHTMVPDSGSWVVLDLELSDIPSNQQVKIAFHSDDNWGEGSGWAINNVMLYTEDIQVNALGYDIYRDGIKMNSALVSNTSYLDQNLSGGAHEYYINTVYTDGSNNSGSIEFLVPHYPPPPPSPDCNPPQNLQANVINTIDNGDILLEWESPEMTITKDNSWDVQFSYPLTRDDEAGFTCDGNYFYTTYLTSSDFGQYDLQGNYLYDAPMFTPSARNLEYVPLTGETFVTFERYFATHVITLPGGQWLGSLTTPGENHFAIAYNEDLDAFYVNVRSSDILLVDRETGNIISSFICRTHGNYYDFAYDNWSAGGPYLWGFSADGPNGCTIVQISLPSGEETGFTYDASWLSTSGNAVPGGLFIQEGLIPGKVSLCGILQGDVMFGLEMGPAQWDFQLGGYNVYMDGTLHSTGLISDTSYVINNPGPGTYSLEVSATYVDSIGDVLCESNMEGPVEVNLTTDVFLIGGNIIAGAYKLDQGLVNIYRLNNGEIVYNQNTQVDDLGYYLFPGMVSADYMMHARPDAGSNFVNTHIPTYTGEKFHWEDVSSTSISSNSYNNDIHLIELAEMETGPGLISGVVYEEDTDNGSPMENVQIMLLNTDGDCISVGYTNFNGMYSFSNLAFGTYHILVEITGKSMEPRTIYLNESSPEQTNIDMVVLSDEIVFGINDDLPEWISFVSNIYPNPASNTCNININIKKPSYLIMSLHDISGRLVNQQQLWLSEGLNTVNIELQKQGDGFYFVSFGFEAGFSMKKKLLLKR